MNRNRLKDTPGGCINAILRSVGVYLGRLSWKTAYILHLISL